MRIRATRVAGWAIVATALCTGAPAHADLVSEVQYGTVVGYEVTVQAKNLVSGAMVTETVVTPLTGGPTHVGSDQVPAEAYDALATATKAADAAVNRPRCAPGGYDLWAYIDGKNILNETLFRFHTDTEFYYDCKVVTAVPFVTVFGSNYSWFWGWDKTIAKETHGVKAKTATVIGAGSLKQCMNYGLGEMCTNHAAEKITWHMFGNGTFTAEGH